MNDPLTTPWDVLLLVAPGRGRDAARRTPLLHPGVYLPGAAGAINEKINECRKREKDQSVLRNVRAKSHIGKISCSFRYVALLLTAGTMCALLFASSAPSRTLSATLGINNSERLI